MGVTATITTMRRTISDFAPDERFAIGQRIKYQSAGELARVFRCSVQTINAIVRAEELAAKTRRDW
jgi:Mor family transcriptional regulator